MMGRLLLLVVLMVVEVLVVLSVLVMVEGHAKESRLMPDYFNHPCIRPCEDESEPMDCEYHFVGESYQTLARACYNCTNGDVADCTRDHCVTANGFSRNIKTINRGIPGPTIQVCEGDTVTVKVDNYFIMAEGLSIHWHGLLQRYTPHMDGVGMITQCPMQSFTSFQYRFVALDSGTHFWHAHTGLQRGEGIFGSLVVRQAPSKEPHAGQYDLDLPQHVLVVSEWQNKPLVELFTAAHHAGISATIDAILINGRAHDPTETLTLPLTELKVEPGKRYRIRVINAGSLFCPIQISVDNHKLLLIASDGRAFEPFEVDSFDTYSAERYDFILTTDQPVDNYWLRARGSATCEDIEEVALVRYVEGKEEEEEEEKEGGEDLNHHPHLPPYPAKRPPPPSSGVRFNSVPMGATGPMGDARDQILHMEALAPDDRSLTDPPDHQFLLDFALDSVDNRHFYDPDLYPPGSSPYRPTLSAQVNRITNRFGPVPLLSQMDEIPEEEFCNSSTAGAGRCEREWCECVHKLTVLQDQVVEMVLISPSSSVNFTHPIHLHGYSFRVVAMDKGPDGIMTPELFREMDARGEIKRKLTRAPFKDTVPVPNGGYVIIRFVADNPGVWFSHCHLQFHVEEGMSFSLEVLQHDGTLPPPPENFPVCGPYVLPQPARPPVGDASQNGAASKPHTLPNPNSTTNHHLHHSDHHHHHPPHDHDHHDHHSYPQFDLPAWVSPVLGVLVATVLLLLAVVAKLWSENHRCHHQRYYGCAPRHLYHVISDQEGEATREDPEVESDEEVAVWAGDRVMMVEVEKEEVEEEEEKGKLRL